MPDTLKESETPEGVYGETNIFRKTVEELVMDGMRNKIAMINDESCDKTSGFYAEDRK